MWRWPPPWRSVKRCGKPQRPPPARADASRQTSTGKGDYSSELESSRKNTKRVRDISRPWALPLTRIARWRSVASCRLSKSPHKRGGHRAPPTSPTPAAFPETMAKKSFAWNFPRPKQWQKKAWLKSSSTQNVARMTLEWPGFESPTRTRCTLRDLQIRHAGQWHRRPIVTACPSCPKRRTEVR
jgi:hypothetical protein